MLIPKGALIVSCQARADNPLHGPVFMSAMAQRRQGGRARASARTAPTTSRRSARSARYPIIGIAKVWNDRFPVYITPGFESAAARSPRLARTSSVSMRRRARATASRSTA